jgi:hypothetical protein
MRKRFSETRLIGFLWEAESYLSVNELGRLDGSINTTSTKRLVGNCVHHVAYRAAE